MKDGIIPVGGRRGRRIGLTVDRFDRGSTYCWKKGDEIYISLILARTPGSGAFRGLLQDIYAAGYTPAVPCPLVQMEGILRRWSWTATVETCRETEESVPVWRPPAGWRPRGCASAASATSR